MNAADATGVSSAQELLREATGALARSGLAIGEGTVLATRVAPLRRRRAFAAAPDGVGYLTLVADDEGILDWRVDGGPSQAPAPGRRSRRRAARSTIVDQVPFKRVHGSEVARFLQGLDRSFNDRRGIFSLDGQPVTKAPARGRALLVVHGTFSKSAALTQQLKSTPAGAKLLSAYGKVLVFEHPTLAVSPIINAIELSRFFDGSKADVDVICHSRGGLVVRWWLEVLERAASGRRRVAFVGCPLQGTALASPLRLRGALKLLTNYAAALRHTAGLASFAVPMFGVVQGLMTLVGSVTGALGRTPLVDAAVAMVPGLGAQSRCGADGAQNLIGNFELESLGLPLRAVPDNYCFVQSDFEPQALGWKLWKIVTEADGRLADAAADRVFAGANDLVVDTLSMTCLGPNATVALPSDRVLTYVHEDGIHHVNYFSDARTADFVRQRFLV